MTQDYRHILAKPQTESRFDQLKRFLSYRDDADYNDNETLEALLELAEERYDV